jgi:hypothetical protein
MIIKGRRRISFSSFWGSRWIISFFAPKGMPYLMEVALSAVWISRKRGKGVEGVT